jgi:hypothetical protein
MFQWLYIYVPSVFICFRRLLQMFYVDVINVYLDVAYIYASVSGVFLYILQVFYLAICNSYTRVFKFFRVFCKCFSCMLQIFWLFRTYVASVSSEC